MPINLYRTLGIKRDATEDAIRKAYRRLAKKYHPDHNPGRPEVTAKFQAVEDAYRVLSDPERKAKYDATGKIDTPTVDKTIADLMSVLSPCMMGVIQNIVKQGGKLSSENVVEHMRKSLNKVLGDLEKNRKEAQKKRDELAAVAERFTTAEGEENLLASAAKSFGMQIEAQMMGIDADMVKIGKASAYLKKCGYKCDAVMEMVLSWPMGTGTTTATGWRV